MATPFSTQLVGSRHRSTRLAAGVVVAYESATGQYLSEVKSWGNPNPQYRKETVVGDAYALVLLPAGPARVYLQSLRSFRSGGGKLGMTALLDLADTMGVTMELDPVPFNKDRLGPDKAALTAWYTRLGFQPVPGEIGSMSREPKQAIEKAASTGWRKRLGGLRLALDGSAVVNTNYLRGNGVVFHIYALVSSKTGANLPGVDSGFTKPVHKLPRELEGEMNDREVVKAEEAAARGELWFTKIGSDRTGVGWRWTEKNGAAQVAGVHAVVYWLLKFATQRVVNGSTAFYVEINNNYPGLG